MYKVSALIAAGLMIATPALAQSRAPITRGVTSSDLAEGMDDSRRQTAELKVQVNGLLGDLMDLTGRIETLEFNLNRANKTSEQLSADNEMLSQEIEAMKRQLADQARLLNQMRSGDPASSGQGELGSTRTQPRVGSTVSSTYPGAAPQGAGTNAAANRSAQTSSGDASATGSSVTRNVRTVTPTGPTRIVRSGDVSDTALTGAAQQARPIVETRASSPDDGTGLGELPSGSLGTIPASALPGEAGSLFAEAKTRYVGFDYTGAEEAFRKFIDAFGDDPQVGEAHYWLGEALYNQKAYAESGSAYTTMIRSFPDDPRAPDALVKLARTMRLLGEDQRACLALDTFPKRYPNASGVAKDLAAVERTKAGCDS